MSRDRTALLISGALITIVFGFMIIEKERHLSDGELLLLELGPRDPRSLIQGDYMRLRYAVIDDTLDALSYTDPRIDREEDLIVVVRVDQRHVAEFSRVASDGEKLADNERTLLLRHKSNGYAIGAETFLFQEGARPRFEQARYGGVKRSRSGSLLLVGLYDEELAQIE